MIDKKIDNISDNLPLLYSDTDDIIEYVEDKKKQEREKYFFWELITNDK